METRTKKDTFTQLLIRFVRYRYSAGMWGFIQRFIFIPRMYVRYILQKFVLRHIQKQITVRTFWGLALRLPTDDSIVFHDFPFPADRAEMRMALYLIKNLEAKDIFYDVGANYGLYTFLAAEFLASGEIHAFEPNHTVFAFLKKNARTLPNKTFVLNETSLSDTTGTSDLYLQEGHSGLSTLEDNVATVFLKDVSTVSVSCITLDSYVQTHKSPTYIKIDVEGSEFKVIEGGAHFFATHSPIIIMEVWASDRGGEDYSLKAVRRLYDLGYTSYKINERGLLEVVSITQDTLLAIDTVFENIVFKKSA